MEYVSFKLEKNVLEQIDRDMKAFHYSTRSDFFREAVREKLKSLGEDKERKKAFKALYATRGIFKGKGKSKTDEEFRALREEAGKEFMEILGKRFNQK
ncbi:MAG: ribbon-helix-helix domain-containing protein [Candidatus Diapherotrites archaeon]